ncbi:MAG: M48 family metallopeptidase [Pyrinomonadaceae bacterium]
MKIQRSNLRLTATVLALVLAIVPVAATAQATQIRASKNKYSVQDDIKLGREAAAQVERKMPVLRDADATNYVERVGRRLVASIPQQFQQPEFNYTFQVVNARDINAFALPGGPMYVNRGMIESARNEGEMAGVMAHEISHVALRHATAQATKQSSAKNTLGTLGLILGGAILGGQGGAQLGAIGAAAWMTKYSREYETQADTLGAQIMADAGYDPRDLANVFRTIQGESRSGAPQWLSSHPDPGNRFEKINREAQYLNVSPNPIKITRDFERVQAKFRAMPRARSLAEIERYGGGQTQTTSSTSSTSSGRYSSVVERPSSELRAYSGTSWLRINVPSNWMNFESQESVQFAPSGAYGDQGITRGLMIGIYQGQTRDLYSASEEYLNNMLQSNSYLQKRTGFTRAYVAGRSGLATSLSGRSPVTGRTEEVGVYTTQLRTGQIFYAVTVVPDTESYLYDNTFRTVLGSIRLGD